ncbi:MAG: hypothetical protein ACP5E4_04270, partial [Candidatus Aenigmatarchaeota archaeon]
MKKAKKNIGKIKESPVEIYEDAPQERSEKPPKGAKKGGAPKQKKGKSVMPAQKPVSEEEEEFFEDSDEDEEEEEGITMDGTSVLDEAFSRAPKKVYRGILQESKVYVWEKQEAEEIYDLGCFGKVVEDKNELSLEEALLLMKRNKLKIEKAGKELNVEEFYAHACDADKEFPWKYSVYEDLRGRGLL